MAVVRLSSTLSGLGGLQLLLLLLSFIFCSDGLERSKNLKLSDYKEGRYKDTPIAGFCALVCPKVSQHVESCKCLNSNNKLAQRCNNRAFTTVNCTCKPGFQIIDKKENKQAIACQGEWSVVILVGITYRVGIAQSAPNARKWTRSLVLEGTFRGAFVSSTALVTCFC